MGRFCAAGAGCLVMLMGVWLGASCEKPAAEAPEPSAVDTDPAPSPPVASRPLPEGLIDVDGKALFVATLVRNQALSVMHPSDYCLEDGRLYEGARFRLGRVNVFGVDEALQSLDTNGPVAVFGTRKSDLSTKIRELGPCPKDREPLHVQMRSDWVAPEGGPNTRRATIAALPFIEGTSVAAVHMAEFLDSDEETVRVRIRNPFTRPFTTIQFDAHYEGGRGKPMPTMVQQVVSLAPGAWTELELPRELEDEVGGPRSKAGSSLHSLEFHGQLGLAELKIEIFVPH